MIFIALYLFLPYKVLAMSEKYIFDFHRIANEIHGYLAMYYLPKEYAYDVVKFVLGLETLLFEDAKIAIELNTNKLIRNYNPTLDPFRDFSREFILDQINMENIITGLASYQHTIDKIGTLMGNDTFMLWGLSKSYKKYIFENYGDIRITQWEQEHLVNGKYVKEPWKHRVRRIKK